MYFKPGEIKIHYICWAPLKFYPDSIHEFNLQKASVREIKTFLQAQICPQIQAQ